MHEHRDARNEEHRDSGKAILASGTTLQRKVTRKKETKGKRNELRKKRICWKKEKKTNAVNPQ